MNNPFISIIIPVYKVERYIHQCVGSVINQTYDNFEVLLIDDGSPDNCPKICDEYAKKDKRIKVIHKENGGLSDARNVGLKEASGEYVIFVDSDDYWNDNNCLKKIMYVAINNDITFFGYHIVNDNKIIENNERKNNKSYNSSSDFIINELKDNLFSWYSWSYIAKKCLYLDNNIEFPIGKLYEDAATTYRLLLESCKIAIMDDIIYCYRKRNDSITNNHKLKSYLDHLEVVNIAINNIKECKCISNDAKKVLLNNFAITYYGVMAELTLLKMEDIKLLYKELVKNKKMINYIYTGKQNILKKIMKIFGINITILIVTIRRIIKYGK